MILDKHYKTCETAGFKLCFKDRIAATSKKSFLKK